MTGFAVPSTFENTEDQEESSVSNNCASLDLDVLETKRSLADCSVPDRSSKTISTVVGVVVSSETIVSVGEVVTCSSGVVSTSTTSSDFWEQEASSVASKIDVTILFIPTLLSFLQEPLDLECRQGLGDLSFLRLA